MSKQETHASYDGFARIYDLHWGSEVPAQIMTVIDKLFVPQMSAGARILDLCCGTGYTAGELSKRGFSVTGLDASEEMLAFARRRAPDASFIQADARSFTMMPIYQGVLSTFDSLNHMMTMEGLLLVFRNVHRALRPGGLFLFDMNMEKAFLAHWADYYAIVEDEDACILRGSYNRDQRLARYDITIFRRRGKTWRRTDAVISERYYPPREIRRALLAAGFKEISSRDAEKEPGLSEHTGRRFFLARKSG